MRYAIVTETYPPEINGVALTVQALEQGLRSRGHEVSVIRPRRTGEIAGSPLEMLVPGLPLPRYAGLRFGLPTPGRLRARWHREPPDAVYVATEGPLGWAAMRAARSLGVPVATGLHTRFDQYMRDYGAPLLAGPALAWMRRFHNLGDATLVPTTELQRALAHDGFKRAVRLPRAVDTMQFDPARRDPGLRREWGLQDGSPAVIHVGRIAPEKNLDLLVRSFRAIQQDQPGARMVWVGDGPMRPALQACNPDFIFCGMQRGVELGRYFASADLFVFPSLSETFGNVTLEAMASGVATVAFDYGAAREHLRQVCPDAVIDPGDPSAFVGAAVRLAGAAESRSSMARAGRDAVRRLRPEQVAADFDALLQGLAAVGADADAALA